jgi:hypothetical protein
MKKKAIIISAVCVLVSIATLGIYLGFTGSQNNPQIVYTHPDYLMDIDNPSVVSGFVDFVFVGKVEQQTGVTYDAVSTRETEDGSISTGLPFTGYDISILENVKGNLKLNQTIAFWKFGGLSMDGQYVSVMEDDFLPEVGDVCVFYANAWDDGTLRIIGKEGNVKLLDSKLTAKSTLRKSSAQINQIAQSELQEVKDSSAYQEIVEACENEIPYERVRFTAPAKFLEPVKVE